MSPAVILITGSRKLQDVEKAESFARLLLKTELTERHPSNITVVHGGAEGWDKLFDRVAKELSINTLAFSMTDEKFNPRSYSTPLQRNQFMVDTVAAWRDAYSLEAECWSFASFWASGTGHCARRARKAGFVVVDYGVDTRDRNYDVREW